MSIQETYPYLSPEEYLNMEENSPIKHEYVDGQIYAMSGTTIAHNEIALNIAAALKGLLRGSPCRVYIADIKARIEILNLYYYPDVMVDCERRQRGSAHSIHNPRVIFEVLSDRTQAFDRDAKFTHYGKLESLDEYVLVHQKLRRVERFHRAAEGEWTTSIYEGNQQLYLESLGVSLPLDTIYEDVDLGVAEAPESNA